MQYNTLLKNNSFVFLQWINICVPEGNQKGSILILSVLLIWSTTQIWLIETGNIGTMRDCITNRDRYEE